MRRPVGQVALVCLLTGVAACGAGEIEVTSTIGAPTESVAAAGTTKVGSTTTPEGKTEPWTESDLVFFERISDGATLTLDIHFPAEPENAPIVNGGPSLVDEGMIVFDVSDDAHLGEGPGGAEAWVNDRAAMRATAERLACAIRFVRARASELGNDDPIVVLTGVSLGGAVATHVGLFGDTLDASWEEFAAEGGPPRQLDCEVTQGSTHVDAVIGMAGTYDLFVPVFDGAYGRAYQQERDPDLQAFFASAIGANPDLKLRLIHGTADYVPLEDTADFAAVLEANGYDVQLTTWGGGHESAPDDLFLSTLLEVLEK